MLLLEIKITSYGLLTVGGVVSLLLGSVMLISSESSLEYISLSLSVIIPTVLLTVLFFAFVIGMAMKAQRRKPATGSEGLVGEIGTVQADLNPEGKVHVHGEIWSAVTDGEKLKKGTKVVVTKLVNLKLMVKKAN